MTKKYQKFILFLILFCLAGAGVFYFSDIWKGSEIQTQTIPSLKLLTSHSNPQTGEEWVVSFETRGPADLTITPTDPDSIGDLDFVSMKCAPSVASAKEGFGQEVNPEIQKGDVLFVPNWSCDGVGIVAHLVNIARKHTLKFQFGDKMAFAYNNPDESTYDFVGVTQESNDYYAYEKSGAAAFTSQNDTGDSEATDTDYDDIESTNDVRWVTEGASEDGHYDSQLYKFYIDEDESRVTQMDFSWEGYGETYGTGYPTDFYAWNYNTSQWDLLQEVTFTTATDQTLTGSKTTDAGNYIDTDKEVTLMVKTKKFCEGNGTVCSTGSECCSGYCVDGYCCNTACSGSLCQTCGALSHLGAGTCGYVSSSSEDPDNDCNPGSTAEDGCSSDYCSGTGYSCGSHLTSGEGGCPACKTCDGATSISCVNMSDDTQDTQGSNTCTATCMKCSGGSCSFQTASEDLFDQCSVISCTTNFLNSATGKSCSTLCSQYTKQTGLCNGSGACAGTNCTCYKINPTGSSYYDDTYVGWDMWNGCSYYYGSCSTVMGQSTITCYGYLTLWTKCYCQ
jgi:hypothetical protein